MVTAGKFITLGPIPAALASWTRGRAAWLLLLLAGCQPDPEVVTIGDLTVEVQLQSRTNRNWQKVSLRRLYEAPREPDVVLYKPGHIISAPDGSFYCIDWGDLKIKRFDHDGNFIQSYGGIGEGPGEFISFTDAAVLGDSVLYAVDLYKRRVSFFDVESAAYLQSISDLHAIRYKITSSGRAYWFDMSFGSALPFGTSRKGEEARLFGTLTEGQTNWDKLVYGGSIALYREHMIHVFHRYPLIIQYDSTGSVIYARGTPDLGRVDNPHLEQIPTGGGLFATRVGGRIINGGGSVYGDELVVYSQPTDSSAAIDLYDAVTGDYESSIAAPLGRSQSLNYDPTRERIWQVRDTTIVVYAVDR